jgi:phosphatidylglycerophosphatase A
LTTSKNSESQNEDAGSAGAGPGIGFVFSHPAHFIALGFGAGLSPKAPGTVGTLLGFPLFWLLSLLSSQTTWTVAAVLFLGGIWACGKTGRDLGRADYGGIVWDEVFAFALVLIFTPVSVGWYIVAFLLFRVFDILKPFPINYYDRILKGGFGVMLDDVLAAAYSVAFLVLIRAVTGL